MYIGNLPCFIATLVYNLIFISLLLLSESSKGKHTHVLNVGANMTLTFYLLYQPSKVEHL